MREDFASSFYALLEGANQYQLLIEVNAESKEPTLLPDGTLATSPKNVLLVAYISAVPLGGDRYRVSENNFFESYELFWGDEFVAVSEGESKIRLKKVVMPKKFQHITSVCEDSWDPEGEEAKLIHKLGGGWDLVFGGLLTITIPVENWAVFEAYMDTAKQSDHIMPGK
jgi:hypothetical protein